MKLWQAAAGQGDARAQCNLGNVRADGRGRRGVRAEAQLEQRVHRAGSEERGLVRDAAGGFRGGVARRRLERDGVVGSSAPAAATARAIASRRSIDASVIFTTALDWWGSAG